MAKENDPGELKLLPCHNFGNCDADANSDLAELNEDEKALFKAKEMEK